MVRVAKTQQKLGFCSIHPHPDPDTALPQIEHLLQTAEAIRQAYPEVCWTNGCKQAPLHPLPITQEEWFHLTGLLHDLGKVLAHPAFGSEPQWAVVGDTFPVGCAHDPRIVYPRLFATNPDTQDPRYGTN